MRLLSIILVFVFLLSSSTSAQVKKNPLKGTTWELISAKYERKDATSTFPESPYDQSILIFGETHYSLVQQDTSRDVNLGATVTYNVDGDNITTIAKMHHVAEGIGEPFTLKFKIEGNRLIMHAADKPFAGYDYISVHQEWKSID